MTRNDEVPQEVDEALESFAFFSDDRKTVLRRVDMVRDYITTLRAKLEAAEGEVARLREDARRYRWLRDSQACSLSLSHNDHHIMYESLEQVFEHNAGDPASDYYGDLSSEDREAMIAADSIWTLHVYPQTPVGFNVYHGATLDAAIDAALGGNANA